jgi:hypothetical protein
MSWDVELEDYGEQIGRITAIVEQWQRQRGAVSTLMYVDGARRRVNARGDEDAAASQPPAGS